MYFFHLTAQSIIHSHQNRDWISALYWLFDLDKFVWWRWRTRQSQKSVSRKSRHSVKPFAQRQKCLLISRQLLTFYRQIYPENKDIFFQNRLICIYLTKRSTPNCKNSNLKVYQTLIKHIGASSSSLNLFHWYRVPQFFWVEVAERVVKLGDICLEK